jgi:hypothetical protein
MKQVNVDPESGSVVSDMLDYLSSQLLPPTTLLLSSELWLLEGIGTRLRVFFSSGTRRIGHGLIMSTRPKMVVWCFRCLVNWFLDVVSD